MYFPYVQALVPMYNTNICICNFYFQLLVGGRTTFVLFGRIGSYLNLLFIAMSGYYVLDFLFLMLMIFMINRNKRIEDKTGTKHESIMVMILWITISLFTFIGFVLK